MMGEGGTVGGRLDDCPGLVAPDAGLVVRLPVLPWLLPMAVLVPAVVEEKGPEPPKPPISPLLPLLLPPLLLPPLLLPPLLLL
jgi:hypothetical protein